MARTKRFTVSAGRQIYCDGRPFLSVNREGETRPTTADALTHKFARDLNRSKITCDTRLDYMDFLGADAAVVAPAAPKPAAPAPAATAGYRRRKRRRR